MITMPSLVSLLHKIGVFVVIFISHFSYLFLFTSAFFFFCASSMYGNVAKTDLTCLACLGSFECVDV